MKEKYIKILNMYFVDGEIPSDIAKTLKVSKSTVTRVLQKDERYSLVKKERTEFREKQHIEKTKTYIKMQRKIQQDKDNASYEQLKIAHNQASGELSDRKRMTNRAYREWNKSAFTYNEKRKGFEFDKSLGRSYDVPEFIKVNLY